MDFSSFGYMQFFYIVIIQMMKDAFYSNKEGFFDIHGNYFADG